MLSPVKLIFFCRLHQVSPSKVPTFCPHTVCKCIVFFGNGVWFGILTPDDRQRVRGGLGKSFYKALVMRTSYHRQVAIETSFFYVALRPNAGQDLLILEVSRSQRRITVGRTPLDE